MKLNSRNVMWGAIGKRGEPRRGIVCAVFHLLVVYNVTKLITSLSYESIWMSRFHSEFVLQWGEHPSIELARPPTEWVNEWEFFLVTCTRTPYTHD